ncbi:MAG: hypothetical protein K2W97_09035 [Chthoniobacterales bacterium]|nr:hypothetical protein [Chthoniobacterales bacterium]
MKTVIKLAVMLVVAGSNLVWADDGSQSELVQLASCSGDTSPSMRVITEREFDGTDPIVISLNESLIIPIHFQRYTLSNSISIFFNTTDTSIMNVVGGGVNYSDDGKLFNINLICTGKQIGETKVQFGEAETVVNEFNIQVVE